MSIDAIRNIGATTQLYDWWDHSEK
jgi:hypothetical protein